MLMLPDTVTAREVADTLRAARQALDALYALKSQLA